MWILLKLVVDKGVASIYVFGDSKLVIDWANGKINLENQLLLIAMENIKEKKRSIKSITFIQIYKELNEFFDKLSKEAFLLHEGYLATTETNERGYLLKEITPIF